MSDLKPNNCKITFECTGENKNCVYGKNSEICKKSKYKNGPYECTDIVAKVNRMILKMKEYDLYQPKVLKKAIKYYGKINQMRKVEEECLELATEVHRFLDGRSTEDKVIDELADVEIMCAQLRLIFDVKKIEKRVDYKLDRLENRINGSEN